MRTPTNTTRGWSTLVAALAVALLGVGATQAVATGDPPAAAAARPALDADVADPEVVIFGEAVIVLATNTTTERGPMNVPVRQWTPSEGWRLMGDALPTVGAWTRPGRIWAPGVGHLADGRWHLYYTSRDRRSGRQCIGHAVGLGPTGPFEDRRRRPVVCDAAEGGSIDASVHVEPDGAWLLWKTEGNVVGRPSSIKSVRLRPDGLPAGPVSVLLRSGLPWERGVVENPQLVRGAGGLVLLHSGGRFGDDTYATGAARCASPAGPCTRSTGTPVLATGGRTLPGLRGPGGASVAVDARGTPQLVFHAWSGGIGYGAGGHRALHTVPIDVDTGVVRLRTERAPVGRADHRPTVTLRSVPAPVGASDSTVRFGGRGGSFLACDLDGDGVDTIVWFRDGVWHRSDRPVTDPGSRTVFGQAGDVPLCADFDGDGVDDRVLRRGDVFLIGPEARGHAPVVPMGRPGDVPIVGDWDGDGDADPGVHRSGEFILRAGPDDVRRIRFGPADATPVVGDWDGDGRTDPGVRVGRRYQLRVGGQALVVPMGSTSSVPLAGRWGPGALVESVGVVDR